MLRTQRRSLSAQIVKSVFAYPLLTVVYTLSGKLGLMLAVPPGYASPIFPAAGIAVTATLMRGRATLPWIFLGSLLLNLWAGYLIDPELAATCVAAAIIIAAASTLQAAIGGAILRRSIGYPAPLDNGRDISRFLLLSPVSCLTSATLSLAGLSVLGVVARPDLATSWISWWIGDTLGVLVVLPLMFVVAGEPRALWRSRALPVAVPMLLFCALFTATTSIKGSTTRTPSVSPIHQEIQLVAKSGRATTSRTDRPASDRVALVRQLTGESSRKRDMSRPLSRGAG